MPIRNWLHSLTAGRIIPAIALLAIVTGYGLATCDLSAAIGSKDKSRYAETNERDADLWAPIPFDHRPIASPYRARCDQPKDHEEADLCQQWRAAEAAEKSARIADSQTYWNWTQLVGTIATVIAAWAAAIAARAAKDSVTVARDTADKELRAHVGVIPQIVSYKTRPHEYSIAVRNYGQTPAYGCSVWSRGAIKPYPHRPDEVFERNNPEVRFTLYKDGPPFGLNGKFARLLAPEEIEGVLQGRLGIYIWGEVVYFDASETERRTPFRYVYGGKVVGTTNLEMCSEGNEST